MSLALSITMFIALFVDIGISSAIIHQQAISQSERSSLYWLNVFVGLVLTVIFAVVSPWIAKFYHEPVLLGVLLIVSPYFLTFAIGQQLRVMAEKELLFSRLVIIEVVSALAGFLSTVLMAARGYGAYSVAVGFLIGAVSFTSLGWRFLSLGWRPNFRFEFSEARKYLSYGLYVIGNNLVSSVNGAADIFMGGRMLGLGALGGFGLPRDLMLNVSGVINSVVTRVGLPLMAKSQGSALGLRHVYLKTLRMTASVNIPIFLGVFAFTPEVVGIMFGEKWVESEPLMRLLALWGMLRSFGQPVGSLIFAVGRADLAFKWNLCWILIIVPCFWYGLQHGASGLAWAMLLLAVVGQIPTWRYLVHPLCGAGFSEYFAQLARPMLASVFTVSLVWMLLSSVTGIYARASLALLAGGCIYPIASYFINRDWLLAMKDILLKSNRASG